VPVSRPLPLGVVIAIALLASCDTSEPTVQWSDAVADSAAARGGVPAGIDAQGTDVTALLPRGEARCDSSVRVAQSKSGTRFAVWWELRGDSTADLVMAHAAPREAFGNPVRVDTSDAGRSGCRRPSPAIVADGQDVHVAYAMAACEGPGIFASHSMDGGMTFHTPVPVVYGENIGRTAIAARGYLVAVAYEDPNSSPQRIGVALSRTQGHLFEYRELVSPPTGPATAPTVSLADSTIVVTWEQGSSDRGATRILRRGRIQ